MDTPSWIYGETSNNGEYKNISTFNIVKVHKKKLEEKLLLKYKFTFISFVFMSLHVNG